MGKLRTAEENELKLPPRCYFKHGAFYYVHKDPPRWEPLGTDLALAKQKARHYNDPAGEYGSISWYVDEYLTWFEAMVKKGKKAPRTFADYKGYAVSIKLYFGKMSPTAVQPHHVHAYLAIGADEDRGVSANREKALLSGMFSWMRLRNLGGISLNPCARTGRNSEKPRARYVTDEEYAKVLDRLTDGSRLALEMEYALLQRPEDILDLERSDVIAHNGQRVLQIVHNKTKQFNVTVRVAIDERLDDVLNRCNPKGHLITSRLGTRYTSDGIGAMIRRLCAQLKIPTFGMQDIKAKGATDMFMRGVSLEHIRQLIGHKKVTTTEIYVKRYAQVVALSNDRARS